jgi:hypothetical protein
MNWLFSFVNGYIRRRSAIESKFESDLGSPIILTPIILLRFKNGRPPEKSHLEKSLDKMGGIYHKVKDLVSKESMRLVASYLL